MYESHQMHSGTLGVKWGGGVQSPTPLPPPSNSSWGKNMAVASCPLRDVV